MKTDKEIVVNTDSKFTIKHVTTRVARAPRTVRYAVTWPRRDPLCFPRDLKSTTKISLAHGCHWSSISSTGSLIGEIKTLIEPVGERVGSGEFVNQDTLVAN